MGEISDLKGSRFVTETFSLAEGFAGGCSGMEVEIGICRDVRMFILKGKLLGWIERHGREFRAFTVFQGKVT